jgi:hypothetical protein
MTRLFHVSEDPSIRRFEPREHPRGGEPCVWAVDEAHLVNYLLPRDCPRVTFYPLPASKPEDIAALMGPTHAAQVVAIEAAWFQRAISTHLYIYELPTETFLCIDAGAGYYTSPTAVEPLEIRHVTSPLAELTSRQAELRVVPSLWPLYEAAVASSLQYSIIRWRNAASRPV